MVMSMMRIEGDPEDLMERMKDVSSVAEKIGSEMGAISSTVVRTDSGVMVVNLWRDEQGRHRMGDHPEIRQALQRANLPEPSAEGYEVLMHRSAEHAATV